MKTDSDKPTEWVNILAGEYVFVVGDEHIVFEVDEKFCSRSVYERDSFPPEHIIPKDAYGVWTWAMRHRRT